jgi:cytosine deaminase
MTGQEAMARCFMAVTEAPARILGLEGYGLAPGCHADLVLLDAGSPVEAIRLRAARRMVLRRGVVVSEAPRAAARLNLPGRPASADFRLGR